jgi:leader peptidase (prepilin peptidase) / N-methyltransferase
VNAAAAVLTHVARVPIRQPLAGLTWVLGALLSVACVAAFGLSADALVAAFFCLVLVTVSAVDVEHRIVPNRIVVPAAGAVLLVQTLLHPGPEWALAALGASGFLLAAAIVYPAGMGMGDVKLALLMGAALGKTVAAGLVVGMFAALFAGMYLLARHGSSARKTGIPFAPFLAFGAVVAVFAGDQLLGWYTAQLY